MDKHKREQHRRLKVAVVDAARVEYRMKELENMRLRDISGPDFWDYVKYVKASRLVGAAMDHLIDFENENEETK